MQSGSQLIDALFKHTFTIYILSRKTGRILANIWADKDSNDLENDYQAIVPTDSDDNKFDHWQQPIEDELLAMSDDVPYLRQTTRNLRFIQSTP